MTDELRRKCEDEAKELSKKCSLGKGMTHNGGVVCDSCITEALLQREKQIERITQNAIKLLSCCDKHTGLSFDDFLRAGGGKCSICLQEKLAVAREALDNANECIKTGLHLGEKNK
jgi:hypothetical protein